MAAPQLNSLDATRLNWLQRVAITCHVDISPLGGTAAGGGVHGYSTISHMMSEANHALFQEYSRYMLPLLGAFSALDQIGGCYSSNSVRQLQGNELNKSNILKALHYFGAISLNTPDADAIYGLRNGLVHSARLVSTGQGTNPKHYWFKINNDNEQLVVHPPIPWDGRFDTRSNDNVTIVNSRALIELVKEILSEVDKQNRQGNVFLVLDNGLEDLLTNYVFIDFVESLEASYQFHLQHIKN